MVKFAKKKMWGLSPPPLAPPPITTVAYAIYQGHGKSTKQRKKLSMGSTTLPLPLNRQKKFSRRYC